MYDLNLLGREVQYSEDEHMALQAGQTTRRSMSAKPPRELLRDLRKRAGYGAAELSRALGYKSTNGYIQYEYAQQGTKPIPTPLITKLIPLLRGRGTPPVTADELIAISDASAFTKPSAEIVKSPTLLNIAAFRPHSAPVGLEIRYRVEPGVFHDPELTSARSYGLSQITPTPDVDPSGQFAVVATAGARVETLHCVEPSQIGIESRKGKRCVCSAERERTGLVEYVLTRIDQDGEPERGKLVGVVIGAYARE